MKLLSVRTLFLLLFLLIISSPSSYAQQAFPELTVQYTNRTTIAKMAFSEDGNILAAVDKSGFLVLRDQRSQISFASMLLKNTEFNDMRFEGNYLFICGDLGLEIVAVLEQKATVFKLIPLPHLRNYVKVREQFIFLGSNGKLLSINQTDLFGTASGFRTIADTKQSLHTITAANDTLYLLGNNNLLKYHFPSNKIAASLRIPYNTGNYGTTIVQPGDKAITAYETTPVIIDLKTGVTSLSLKDYRLKTIDSLPSFEVGEMGIKAANIIDERMKTIYLANTFSAATISGNLLALGDYYGNIFFYDSRNNIVLNKISSTTTVNNYADFSSDGRLMALSSGNTRTSLLKIIDLQNGKTLFEQVNQKQDISKMFFGKHDSSLFVFYPDASIHELHIDGDKVRRQVLSTGAEVAENRTLQLVNLSIGAGAAQSMLAEADFINTTEQMGQYELFTSDSLTVLLSRAANIEKNKMPSAFFVQQILTQFDLTKEAALSDQLDQDMFVMKAINYSEERFMAFVTDKKIDATKAKKLFDYLQGGMGESIVVKRRGLPDLHIALEERPRNLVIVPSMHTLFVVGAETLCTFRYDQAITKQSLRFRNKESFANYFFDIPNHRFATLDAAKVVIYDLDQQKEQFRFYSFRGSVLYQVPGGYYYATGRIPPVAFVYMGKLFNFGQLDLQYHRPDLVLTTMGSSDKALIAAYRKAYERRMRKMGIDTRQFQNSLLIPELGFGGQNLIGEDHVTLSVEASGQLSPLQRLNIWVNEVPLFGMQGIHLNNLARLDSSFDVELSLGENRIETAVTNVAGMESYKSPLVINYHPNKTPASTTYFIGIGIDRFASKGYNLQYSVKDIRDIATTLTKRYNNNIIIDTLFDENVTIDKIRRLKARLQETTVNDKVIIAYSGHGLLSDSLDYFLSTYTINFKQPEQNGLAYRELEDLLDGIPARKKLLLIDACHSGEVDKEELQPMNKKADSLGIKRGARGGGTERTTDTQVGLASSFDIMQSLFVDLGKSTGATIISAAAGNQYALEGVNNLSNGVFTYSLIEAMNNNKTIKISTLKKMLGERVEQLTNGLQRPTSRNEMLMVDWEL